MNDVTTQHMDKMMRAFMAVHHPDEKDEIGPNKPDAPFFERLQAALRDEEDPVRIEAMYGEAAERFYKYRNTQIPWLAKAAGLEVTDVQKFLDVLKTKGEQAKRTLERIRKEDAAIQDEQTALRREMKAAIRSGEGGEQFHRAAVVDRFTCLPGHERHFAGDLAGSISDLWDMLVEEHAMHIQRERERKTVRASIYEDVWYGKRDVQRRYPKKSQRIRLDFPLNYALKDDLKAGVGFPMLKWSGQFWSLALSKDAIERASNIFRRHDFNPEQVEALLDSVPAPKPQSKADVSATVEGGTTVVLKWPWLEDYDLRTKVLTIVKGAMGRKWDSGRKAWLVPLSQATFLKGRLDGVYQPLADAIADLPSLAAAMEDTAARIAISSAAELKDEEVIEDMRSRLAEQFPEGRELYPFQYVGVRFAELAGGRALIGDDMGVGKTIQALAYIALHPENHPALVVCPANVKFNWLKEAQAWLPNLSSAVVQNGKADIPDTDIVVVNYDLMSKQEAALAQRGFNIVVMDESHYLKNSKAKRTQSTLALAKESKDALCLSGTAITNRPLEFFTTLNLLRPVEFGNFFAFAKRYTDAHHNGWGWDFKGSSNEEELHERTRSLAIRRLKKEVMAELPDKIRQIETVTPSAADLRTYRRVHNEWLAEYSRHQEAGGTPPGFVLNMLTDLRHHAGRLKVQATVDKVNDYRDITGKPIVVFAHHRDVIEMLSEELSDEHEVGFITGEVSAEKRQVAVDKFQSGNLDVLVCSTVAAKEGLTLTAADTVLFVEREWVPGWEEQAEDRVNRIGQDAETVHAIYLSVANTIDEKFDAVIEEKRKVVQAILDGGEVGKRDGIAKSLLKSMVEAGDVPKTMLKHM